MLVGANGRMGQAIQHAAAKVASISIVCVLNHIPESAENTDVVIDFSSDHGARRAVAIATKLNAALLVGTTSLSEKTLLDIENASQKISAIKISNSSLGIAILTRLASVASTILGSKASITIQETHHAHKKDSPSGTAITLADALRKSGATISNTNIQSIRQGEVVGHHRVTFEMENETLSLEHRALSRELFATGALRIADWLRHQPTGMHTAQEWLSDLLLKENKS
ncbi:MAG: 4-hydroxy-tetrahydrodipicolinate reductase [Phycisphaerales bacterium]|nr:4-hydroxy-tetrahydrodipicolinate reductase [Phycisphaerales bacterium]